MTEHKGFLPVNPDVDDSADDPTWQALEDLRLDMRKQPTMRSDKLRDALTASLSNLGDAAASLAAEGGLEGGARTPLDTLPGETAEVAQKDPGEPSASAPVDSAPAAESPETAPADESPETAAEPTSEMVVQGSLPAVVNGPLAGPAIEAQAPDAGAGWRVGASRANPVPPVTTAIPPPWAPINGRHPAPPAADSGQPTSTAEPLPAAIPEPDEQLIDPERELQMIVARIREDPALAASFGGRVRARDVTDSERSAATVRHAWVLVLVGAVVILTSAAVTYLLLHG